MNLTQQRADLGQALAAVTFPALTVHRFVPESISAPALVIEPGEPYLSTDEGTTFGEYRVRYDVIAVVAVATNEKATGDLDALIEAAAAALHGAYTVEQVSQPFGYQSNGAVHLAAILTLSDRTDLTTEQE